MVRIAIAEDDKNEMQVLRSYVERCSKERGFLCAVDCFTDGDAIAENIRNGYDIIFLDIEMPLMNGMDAAEQIREADKDVTLIFTTHNPNYAIRGYKVQALDYILKPVSYNSKQKKTQPEPVVETPHDKPVYVSISKRPSVHSIRYQTEAVISPDSIPYMEEHIDTLKEIAQAIKEETLRDTIIFRHEPIPASEYEPHLTKESPSKPSDWNIQLAYSGQTGRRRSGRSVLLAGGKGPACGSGRGIGAIAQSLGRGSVRTPQTDRSVCGGFGL